MSHTVLVIGASGILGPAAAELVARGAHVIGVSRGGRPSPPGVVPVHVDARDARAFPTTLAGMHWDDALVYAPAVSDESVEALHGLTPGRCVLVRTSSAADPVGGELTVPPVTLQLGWTAGMPHRWHTPDEVSAAALEVLAGGTGRTLGVVRPWSDRP